MNDEETKKNVMAPQPGVNKGIIYIPFNVIEITCKHCKIQFVVLGITGTTYHLQGNNNTSKKLYCPYCGKYAY